MQILAVDVGTGTQDILLYDSRLDLENAFKLILPSPTMMVRRRIQAAAHRRAPVLLSGVNMGGGPSHWAAEDHLRLGLTIYATPEAALSFNDDLAKIAEMGIQLVSPDEALRLPPNVERIELKDFDFPAIRATFETYGLDLHHLEAVAVAVFDHGNAPPGVSDRQFRFDYLDERIRAENRLSAFAYPAANIPPIMTRLQAVAQSAGKLDFPLVVMDTAPAAVLGALFDPQVGSVARKIILNVGNFHTLAFRLGNDGIHGVFEHHTGLIDLPKLESLVRRLADGSLQHRDVFEDNGHGALLYRPEPFDLELGHFGVAVTGPRRRLMQASSLRPYFAVPFGDMMIAGCIGLLAAVADVLPNLAGEIHASLNGQGGAGTPPWEI